MNRVASAALCLAIAVPAGTDAGELGRLFHSAAERLALDAARQNSLQPRPASAVAQVRIDGYVQRTGGRSTVWVNGHARPAESLDGEPRVALRAERPGVVAVQLGRDGPSVEVRVGDTLELAAGDGRP